MTTVLPIIGTIWVALCTALMAFDPAFTVGRDHLVGAAVGFTVGIISSAVIYGAIRVTIWIIRGVA